MAVMSNSLKAALLSGLVLPGLGQIVLKRYKRGVVLMLIVLACFSVVVVKAVQQALAVLNQIQSAGGIISTGEIPNAARQVALTSDSLLFNLASVSLVFCWIIGIVDAYRIGKKMDVEVSSAGTLPQESRR